jgi:hypothetical protein
MNSKENKSANKLRCAAKRAVSWLDHSNCCNLPDDGELGSMSIDMRELRAAIPNYPFGYDFEEDIPAQQPAATGSVDKPSIDEPLVFMQRFNNADFVHVAKKAYADLLAWHAAGVAAASEDEAWRGHVKATEAIKRAEKAEAERDEAQRELAKHLAKESK